MGKFFKWLLIMAICASAIYPLFIRHRTPQLTSSQGKTAVQLRQQSPRPRKDLPKPSSLQKTITSPPLVYLYRKFGWLGIWEVIPIHYNGHLIGNLKNNTGLAIRLKPGKHSFYNTDSKDGIKINCQPDKTYFIETSVSWFGKNLIHPVPIQEGAPAVKKIPMHSLDFTRFILTIKPPKKSFPWLETIVGVILSLIFGGFQLLVFLINAVDSVITKLFGPPQIEQLKNKRNIPKLVKALFYKKRRTDPKTSQVRFAAAAALAENGGIPEIAPLILALNDGNFQVVNAAAHAIATLVFHQIRQPISAAYQGQHPEQLPEKLALLQQIQLKAVGPLIQVFQRSPSDMSVMSLGMIAGPEAATFLIKVLGGQNTPYIQTTAAHALLNTGDPRAVEPLIKALNHQDKSVQLAAVNSLGGFGNRQAIAPLLNMLVHSDGEVRKAAATSLVSLGENKWRQWVMGDSDDFQRLTHSEDPQALELVIKVASNVNSNLRRLATTALADGADLQDERVKNRVLEAAYDPDNLIREAALKAIAKSGNDLLVPVLIASLSNNNSYIRCSALEELVKLGDQRAVEPIIKLLGTDLAGKAAQALGKLGDRAAVDPLIKAMNNVDPSLLPTIAHTLNELGDQRWEGWIKGEGEDCLRLIQSGDPQGVALGRALQAPLTRRLIGELRSQNFSQRKSAAETLIRFTEDPPGDLISQWQEVRRLITEPREHAWEDNGRSSDCTGTYYDSGIGLDFPNRPKR